MASWFILDFFWIYFAVNSYLFEILYEISNSPNIKGLKDGFYVNKSECPIYWNDRISEFDNS